MMTEINQKSGAHGDEILQSDELKRSWVWHWPASCIQKIRKSNMHPELRNSASTGAELEVMLDGKPVVLPAQRRSLAAIRSYLETLALEQQRILFSLRVDGARVNLSAMLPTQ